MIMIMNDPDLPNSLLDGRLDILSIILYICMYTHKALLYANLQLQRVKQHL